MKALRGWSLKGSGMGSNNIAVHYTLRLVKTESGTGRRKPGITVYGSVNLKGRESETDLAGGVRSDAGRFEQAEFFEAGYQ